MDSLRETEGKYLSSVNHATMNACTGSPAAIEHDHPVEEFGYQLLLAGGVAASVKRAEKHGHTRSEDVH